MNSANANAYIAIEPMYPNSSVHPVIPASVELPVKYWMNVTDPPFLADNSIQYIARVASSERDDACKDERESRRRLGDCRYDPEHGIDATTNHSTESPRYAFRESKTVVCHW